MVLYYGRKPVFHNGGIYSGYKYRPDSVTARRAAYAALLFFRRFFTLICIISFFGGFLL